MCILFVRDVFVASCVSQTWWCMHRCFAYGRACMNAGALRSHLGTISAQLLPRDQKNTTISQTITPVDLSRCASGRDQLFCHG